MLLRTNAPQDECFSGRLPLRAIASQDECFSRRILITIHINEETADKQSMIIHGGSSAVSLSLYGNEDCCPAMREAVLVSSIYANSEPQPNAKYSCAASVAIAR